MREKSQFLGLVLFLILPSLVFGSGIEKANTLMDNVYTAMHAIAIITVTVCIMWVGYKILFGGRALQEFGGVILGAICIASAAEIAAFLIS